jgi:hypothetical protein
MNMSDTMTYAMHLFQESWSNFFHILLQATTTIPLVIEWINFEWVSINKMEHRFHKLHKIHVLIQMNPIM